MSLPQSPNALITSLLPSMLLTSTFLCREKFQGSFDPYFQIFSSHNSPDYIIIFVNTCATNFSFQEIFDILEGLRRGSKDGCQAARYDGTDVEDSFPFDNG